MCRLLSAVFFTLFIFQQLIVPSHAQDNIRRVEITENADYNGFDLRAEKNVTLDQCKSMCLAEEQCKAFTFNGNVNWCFLKTDFRDVEKFDGATAGKIVEVASEPDMGAAPELSFVPAGSKQQATRYLKSLAKVQAAPTGMGVTEILAAAAENMQVGKGKEALVQFQQALKLDKDKPDLWIDLSRRGMSYLAGRKNRDYQVQGFLISSALNGYLQTRTKSKRADALFVLGVAFEWNSQYRPAIDALKASLALQNSKEVSGVFARLRDKHGFRVVGNTVDVETSTPRICIQFSEPLVESGVDYSSFMTVDGKPAAVDLSERQLCAQGLEHGNTYNVAIRSGLPSTVDEVLKQPLVINSYVRDREPSLRFDGNNFVLPVSGRRGIPIISVNSSSANLELYRVGERGLSRLLSGSNFLSQLGGYELERVRDDLGQAIWKGKIDLATDRNREATTSFPVDEALPNREPGIYVLTASPKEVASEYWQNKATQWFLVSDIGLSTIKGGDGFSVISRSLESAKPISNVEMTLIARNNEILGTAKTDEKGIAKFPVGLMRGSAGLKPAVVTAKSEQGADFVFLDLRNGAFDLSDRGVEGRAAPGPIDIFLYNDRGIYRAGELINSVALMRDDGADALENVPLTFIYRRPDGVEARRIVSSSGSVGGHIVPYHLGNNAMRGTWNLSVYTDPEDTALAEKSFLVEDFIPDRTEFELTSSTKLITAIAPAVMNLDGKFLYGAPAGGLNLEGEIRANTVRTINGFSGFKFGLDDEENTGSSVYPLSGLPKTDENGHAEFEAYLGTLPATTRPIEASVVVRMREDGGRAIERKLDLPVRAEGPMIGIRPNFDDDSVSENSVAEFDVIAVDPDGNKIDLSGLKWSLQKIERNYQWHRSDGRWRYNAVTVPRLAGNGTVDATSVGTAKISTTVKWGTYRLEIESDDASGPATSVEFSAGWFVEGGSVDTPDALDISFDKERYAVGDKATLTISPRFAGELIVAIGTDQLHETLSINVPADGAKLDIPVKAEWGAGAYVTAILMRPGGSKENSRMPLRAIGTSWLQVDPGSRKLNVRLELPEKTRPSETLAIPVVIDGLKPDETAYVTVAAVDVGILNLTRYKPPQPSDYYHGQRSLGLEFRDIYGRLIDASQGEFGKLQTGGDASGLRPEGSPPTQKLLSFFSGVVKVDDKGRATIEFELPQFNGTARVMAVAWTKQGVGSANGDVIIRDPVVLTASLPKVLAPEDVAEIVVEIANTDGPAGEYALSLDASDVISIDAGGIPSAVNLAAGERKSFVVSLTANKPGTIGLTLNASFEGETVSSVVQDVFVRPSTLPVTQRTEFPMVADGGSFTLDKELLEGSITQGASVSVNVSSSTAFDLPGLLMKLDRYPYGCAEQTTSKALPLLYLSDFGASKGLIDADDLRERVQGAITRVLSYQSSSGSFGLWGPGSGDLWLDSYVTDFLTRASEKGFQIPEIGMRLSVDNLKNSLGYAGDISENGNEIAYMLYVLARNKAASAGDLRYYADTKLEEFKTPLARAHLGAALALYNDVARSNKAFGSAFNLASNNATITLARADYGSTLRDGAAMLALASESKPTSPLVGQMSQLVANELKLRTYTSTQENAWMLLAARAIQEEDAAIQLSVNGTDHQGAYAAKFSGDTLSEEPITVVSQMSRQLVAVVSSVASPSVPLSAGGDGFTIERKYYRLDGTETTLNDVKQNERFLVVIKFDQDNPWSSRVIMTDLLPGGFEIDNPRLINSADVKGFDWLPSLDAVHTEFRKDRFVAAFDHKSSGQGGHTVAYMVRAVTPGTYVHPAASVEDMYRPQFQARTATGFFKIAAAK